MSNMASLSWLLGVLILSQNLPVRSAPLAPAIIARDEASNPPLTYITLEEHFDSHAILPYQEEDGVYQLYDELVSPAYTKTLRNISVRIPDMNANGIKTQVCPSHSYLK